MCMWCEMCVCMWCEMCVCFKGEMQSNMSVSVQINKSFVTDITCMVGIQEYTHTHTTHTHTHTHTHTQVPHISVNLLCCTYCGWCFKDSYYFIFRGKSLQPFQQDAHIYAVCNEGKLFLITA